MINKNILSLATFILLLFTNCKKPNNSPGPSVMLPQMYFPLDATPYWKAYYFAPSGFGNMFNYAIDSIFLSSDTVQVNTITYQNPIPIAKTYQVLKVFRKGVRFATPFTWDTIGISNFAVLRIDTAAGIIYRIHTPDYSTPSAPFSYPSPYNFIEGLIYNHNFVTGDTASLLIDNTTYLCDIHVDSVLFGSNYLKRHFFTDMFTFDSVSHRMQLGCIFSATNFSAMVLPCLGVPNAEITKLMFYSSVNDSIEIRVDQNKHP